MTSLDSVLLRGVEKIYPSTDSLSDLLKSGRKLRIYYGIDPTSPNIHIGHSVPLNKLSELQNLGHKIILLFGDFTAMIGDPSERTIERKQLTAKEIKQNVATYKNQVAKIISFRKNPPEIVYNSSWWEKMSQADFFSLLSKFTTSQLLERDMFQERIKKNKPIFVSEFLYPILQGYDSVALDVDMEIGATDQTFNMMVGRQLLRQEKNKEKFVLTTPLLEGTDGRKMSKTYANSINLTENPNDMFGKAMSIKDELIVKYFTLATNVSSKQIAEISKKIQEKSINPIGAKKKLAYQLVRKYHSEEVAKKAQEEFERVFQKGGRTTNIETITKPKSLLPVSYASLTTLSGGTESVSEAVRLAENKGLRFDGKLIENPRENIPQPSSETVIDIGKRKSIRIVWED